MSEGQVDQCPENQWWDKIEELEQACAQKDQEIALLKHIQACELKGWQERTAAYDQRIAELEAQLRQATESESDAGIYFARCEQHAQRITQLEALLDRVAHYDGVGCIQNLGDLPCHNDCPACAWARLKQTQ